jgi:dienelactone hydrolase
VVLAHNWWGMTDIVRRMAHLYAQMGYYTIVPALFDGNKPQNHHEAMQAVKNMGEEGYLGIDAALSILETHHMCNHKNAVVGVGMGGSLAFETAIRRDDLEVAGAFYGFPHKSFGRFGQSNTPILAVYGDDDAIIKPPVIHKLKNELSSTDLKDDHKVVLITGAPHDFIVDNADAIGRQHVKKAWQLAIDFIETYIKPPKNPHKQVI